MAKSVRLFEQAAHAQLYSKYRPTYPKELMSIIHSYVKHKGSGFGKALDVACGSGQSTFHLLEHFERCVGVDISEAQVEEARKKAADFDAARVEFLVGDATCLPVDSGSVDLVGCGQAWHWLDASSFYKEAKRILKPSGTLAVYGYGNCRLTNEECNQKLFHFYGNILKGYWHSNRRFVDREYQDVDLPFKDTERHDLSMSYSLPLSGFIGYVSSWSGYCKYAECNAGSTVLEELGDALRGILLPQPESASKEPIVDLVFPVYVNLGCKP